MSLTPKQKEEIFKAAGKKHSSLTIQMGFMVFFCLFIGFGFTLGAHYANYLIGIWF